MSQRLSGIVAIGQLNLVSKETFYGGSEFGLPRGLGYVKVCVLKSQSGRDS